MPPNLEKRIEVLEQVIQDLRASTTIPFDIRGAFNAESSDLSASGKAANAENQAVNEAGAASYDVLKEPDGFDQRNDGGVIKHFPYYTD